MAIKSDIRNYYLIAAELCMLTFNLFNNLMWDLIDLTPFGITPPKINK
jgi:hypothetical protein